MTIPEFQQLHNDRKADECRTPYPVKDKFTIEKTRILKEAVKETRYHPNGAPYIHIVSEAITKRVFDTNGFTKLALAYLQYHGFEAKRISSEGKWRKGIGYIASENKGIADIMALKDGKVYFIEIKQPKEKQLESQVKFEAWANKGGAFYSTVRGWDDLQNKIQNILAHCG